MELIFSIWLSVSILPQANQSQEAFCNSRTTEALHSPACPNSFAEHDAGRIEDAHIQHDPAYHTYSTWTLGGDSYTVAYWDEDNDPLDTQADIYLDQKGGAVPSGKKLITIPVFDCIEQVFKQDFTNSGHGELVFISYTGQLEGIRIVRLNAGRAHLLFDNAGTFVKVGGGKAPDISIYANTPDETEVFRWSRWRHRFHRVAVLHGKPAE